MTGVASVVLADWFGGLVDHNNVFIYSNPHPRVCFIDFLMKILFIYFKREREGGRKRGREISTCKRNIDRLPLAHSQLGTRPTTQARALTGN